MPEEIITADEFRKRLAQLCTTGRSTDLPRKSRDRAISLKSVALTLEAGRSYSEMDLKAALSAWTGAVGNSMQVDHAALRRNLVDEKYLGRSTDGRSYHLIADANAALFAPEIGLLDPAAVVDDSILEAAARREAFRNKQT